MKQTNIHCTIIWHLLRQYNKKKNIEKQSFVKDVICFERSRQLFSDWAKFRLLDNLIGCAYSILIGWVLVSNWREI